MKVSKIVVLAACVLGTAGIGAGAAAAVERSGHAAHQERMHHKHRSAPPLARLMQKLDLTDAQRQSVRSIVDSSSAQRKALREERHANVQALTSTMPDDPNYPAVIEQSKQLASAAIQHRSDVNVQLYSVLTKEQQARVPQLIEEMKARAKERRDHRGKRGHDESSLHRSKSGGSTNL